MGPCPPACRHPHTPTPWGTCQWIGSVVGVLHPMEATGQKQEALGVGACPLVSSQVPQPEALAPAPGRSHIHMVISACELATGRGSSSCGQRGRRGAWPPSPTAPDHVPAPPTGPSLLNLGCSGGGAGGGAPVQAGQRAFAVCTHVVVSDDNGHTFV